MENRMKKTLVVAFALALFAGTGCAYSGVALSADGSTAVVLKNNALLFGIMREIYVCQVTPAGLAQCVAGAKP